MSKETVQALRGYVADLRKMATREPVVIDPEKLADCIEAYIRQKEGAIEWRESDPMEPINGSSAN